MSTGAENELARRHRDHRPNRALTDERLRLESGLRVHTCVGPALSPASKVVPGVERQAGDRARVAVCFELPSLPRVPDFRPGRGGDLSRPIGRLSFAAAENVPYVRNSFFAPSPTG